MHKEGQEGWESSKGVPRDIIVLSNSKEDTNMKNERRMDNSSMSMYDDKGRS